MIEKYREIYVHNNHKIVWIEKERSFDFINMIFSSSTSMPFLLYVHSFLFKIQLLVCKIWKSIDSIPWKHCLTENVGCSFTYNGQNTSNHYHCINSTIQASEYTVLMSILSPIYPHQARKTKKSSSPYFYQISHTK